MTKKRAIVSYDKLDIEQKKNLLRAFPDGFSDNMTTIKTPTGDTLDALLWETEEIVYLVKLPKPSYKSKSIDDDDDDEDYDDLPKVDDLKAEMEDDYDDDDSDDEYDQPDAEEEDEDED